MDTYSREVTMRPNWQQPGGSCSADATSLRHGVVFMNEINGRQQIRELIVVRPNVPT
jgi:hypothetical protein